MVDILPPALKTGQKQIDEDHLNILRIMEVITESKEIDSYIDDLRSHFCSHFQREERLMEDTNYWDTWAHQEEHKKFFDHFTHLRAWHEKYNSETTRIMFIAGLMEWTQNHILNSDIKMARWVREHHLEILPHDGPRDGTGGDTKAA